jgi:hypothetical protein
LAVTYHHWITQWVHVTSAGSMYLRFQRGVVGLLVG